MITDDDIKAAIIAYGKARISGDVNRWVSAAGMRAAAEEIERRVMARSAPELRPMHEPVTDAELHAMLDEIIAGVRAAGVQQDHVRRAGNALLARRAAAPRPPVVVTEEMRQECSHNLQAYRDVWSNTPQEDASNMALDWLRDHLNGEHEKPGDPRVEIVRAFVLGGVRHSDNIDKEIEIFLERLDEVKP